MARQVSNGAVGRRERGLSHSRRFPPRRPTNPSPARLPRRQLQREGRAPSRGSTSPRSVPEARMRASPDWPAGDGCDGERDAVRPLDDLLSATVVVVATPVAAWWVAGLVDLSRRSPAPTTWSGRRGSPVSSNCDWCVGGCRNTGFRSGRCLGPVAAPPVPPVAGPHRAPRCCRSPRRVHLADDDHSCDRREHRWCDGRLLEARLSSGW